MLADQEDNFFPLHASLACHRMGASQHVRPMSAGPLQGRGKPQTSVESHGVWIGCYPASVSSRASCFSLSRP